MSSKPPPPSKKRTPAVGNGASGKPPFPYPFLLLLTLLFLLCAGIGVGLLHIGQTVPAYVFFALAAAVVLFGFLKSDGSVKTSTYWFTGAAALFLVTLSILLYQIGPAGDSLQGTVYVDGQPVTKGKITLLGTALSDNHRDFNEGNPGHFDFHTVPNLSETLKFQIDADGPVDLPPQIVEQRKQREPLEIHLTTPPAPKESALAPQWNSAPIPLENFVGRTRELAELDQAWQSGVQDLSCTKQTAQDKAQDKPCIPQRVVAFVAGGGFGKTALVRQWLYLQEQQSWNGQPPDGLFWWTFGDNANVDSFVLEAIAYFSGKPPQPGDYKTDGEKLTALRKAINKRRVVLVLDGLEPAQRSERGEDFGKAQNPLTAMLLKELANGGFGPGLALITSRLHIADLAGHPAYQEIPLEQRPLDAASARSLLRKDGVAQASDGELDEIVKSLGAHPLALKTLALLLKNHNQGQAAGWQDFVRDDQLLTPPSGHESERQLWRVLGWYDRNLPPEELRLIQVLAHFREPVDEAWAKALFVAPNGLEPEKLEAVQEQTRTQAFICWLLQQRGKSCTVKPVTAQPPQFQPWTIAALHEAIDHLKNLRLVELNKVGRYAMHPVVSEHFRATTAQSQPIHAALYRLYTETIQPKPQPDTLEEMQPLYEAVYHGCRAGQWQQALDEVYKARILRGNKFYSTKKLVAFAADLDAVRQFFDRPWQQVNPRLRPAHQAMMYAVAAFDLRALGRLPEALLPMQTALEMDIKQQDWKNAAVDTGNISEWALTLGQIDTAVEAAKQSVDYADRSGDAFERMSKRTTLADALHQQGEAARALALFREAETMQQKMQPQYPLLYSLQGFRYVDRLLAEAEQAAWAVFLQAPKPATPRPPLSQHLTETQRRVEQTLAQMEADNHAPLLTIALDHLSLGRIALYCRLLDKPADAAAQRELDSAVDGLRKSGNMDYLPRALLTRAWLHSLEQRPKEAQADLDEAWAIAEAGGMKLHQADIQLTRARLFHDRAALAQARQLIEATGYARRRPELQAAEALLSFPGDSVNAIMKPWKAL